MKNRLDLLEQELTDLENREERYKKMFGPDAIKSNRYLMDKLEIGRAHV